MQVEALQAELMRSHAEAMEVGAQLSLARDELEKSRHQANEYKVELESLTAQLNDTKEALVGFSFNSD